MNTDGLKGLWKTVFGDTDFFIDSFFDVAFSPDRYRCIQENGEIVSALYWLDCLWEGRKIAYIYAVATDPRFRGRGIASRLMEDTHAQLKEQGYAGAVLKPAKGLFPFYERLGYRTNSFVRYFSVDAKDPPIPVKPVSPAEHARLRRILLPENSILQEGVTLDFLHLFADVYAAADALICVDPESGTVLEYLGSPDSAPGILASLGIKQAQLRSPGQDVPFTMWIPLNCTKMPGYLGITLE